jgi:copper transport protein
VRATRRAAAVLALAFAALVAAAAPAAAHASLESTSPAAGQRLDAPPPALVLTFDEPVSTTPGSIRLFDDTGRRLDLGRVERDGHDVRASVPDLGAGVYIATWRVTSADAHPIHGAFTFQVGDAHARGDTQALARRLLAEQGGRTSTGFAYAVQRAVVFAAVIVLVGGTAFVGVLWPAGRDDVRTRRVLTWAWGAAVAATVVGIGLHAAYAAGLGVGKAFDPSVVREELGTRFADASLWRLGLLVVGGFALVRRWWPAAAIAAVGALATFGWAGHAGSGDLVGLALGADVVHLAAVSVWLGGLAILATCVVRTGDDAVAAVAPRFSRVAFAAVAAVVATGAFQGWRQTRSLDALDGTTYGRLLLVKIALVAVLIGVAWAARRWVQGRRRVPTASFARTIGIETTVAVAVVIVTALLVNAQPGRTALAQPFSTTLEAGPLLVDLTVDPAKAGPADVHLYTLDEQGQVADVDDVTVALRLAARDVGPLAVPMQRAGPGHFAAYGIDLPFPGTWELDVAVRTSDVDEHRATTRVRIR